MQPRLPLSSSLPAGLSAEGWQAGQTGFSFFIRAY